MMLRRNPLQLSFHTVCYIFLQLAILSSRTRPIIWMAFGLFSTCTSPKVTGVVPENIGGVLGVISLRVDKAEEQFD